MTLIMRAALKSSFSPTSRAAVLNEVFFCRLVRGHTGFLHVARATLSCVCERMRVRSLPT